MKHKLPAETVYLIYSTITAVLYTLVFTVNMVYFVRVAHLDPLQLVLVGTVLETTIFIFEVPTGIVADTYSRRLSVIIGVFIIGASFVVQGLFPFFIPILISQVLWGIGYTFTSGAQQAWISDEVGEERTAQIYLRGARYEQIGGLIATVLSVALAFNVLNAPIITGGVLFWGLGIFLILAMPENGYKPTPAEDRTSFQQMAQTFRGGIGAIRIRPALVGILLIGLFFGLYSEGFDRLWTASLLDRFTLPGLEFLPEVTWFGALGIVEMLLAALATRLLESYVDMRRPHKLVRMLTTLSFFLTICLFGFALSGNLWLTLFLLVAISLCRTLISPLYTSWVNHKLDPQVRATVISMSSQVDAFGQIAGGPVLGVIARNISMQAGLLGSAFFLTPVLFLFARQIKNRENIQVE